MKTFNLLQEVSREFCLNCVDDARTALDDGVKFQMTIPCLDGIQDKSNKSCDAIFDDLN